MNSNYHQPEQEAATTDSLLLPSANAASRSVSTKMTTSPSQHVYSTPYQLPQVHQHQPQHSHQHLPQNQHQHQHQPPAHHQPHQQDQHQHQYPPPHGPLHLQAHHHHLPPSRAYAPSASDDQAANSQASYPHQHASALPLPLPGPAPSTQQQEQQQHPSPLHPQPYSLQHQLSPQHMQHLQQQQQQQHHPEMRPPHLPLPQHALMPPTHLHHLPPAGYMTRQEEMSPTSGSMRLQVTLAPLSKVDEGTGRKYQLDVVQQPKRARMCGFGDKDRRPITPPPCVRLIITDAATGREIDCNSIDHSMFVLNVDLWNEDGTREVNLVRSSTGSPSISSTTPFSYSTLNGGDGTMMPYAQHVLPSNRDSAYNQTAGYMPDYHFHPGYAHGSPPFAPNGSYEHTQQFYAQNPSYRQNGTVASVPSQAGMAHFTRNGVPAASDYIHESPSMSRMAMVGGQAQGMFTRNLIGSLAASAFRLSDTSDHIGIWFVLQDLSVRTEGSFRLRFSFVNVGARGGPRRDGSAPKVNVGRAPILASCFSEKFSVYSAKKFPGVCESTALSKTFATQGIKIPIRKDANVKSGEDEDYAE